MSGRAFDEGVETVPGGVFLETYGCQMNLADSEVVMALLEERGYQRVDRAEQAEVVLVNTCAIREHAQAKAISNIGRYRFLKKLHPETRFGVLGCLSRHAAGPIAEQLPFLDWILGPDVYRDLPALLNTPRSDSPYIQTTGTPDELYDNILPARRNGANAWVSITRGCDNHCTYCVVPSVRGHERHRPAESILREVRHAVDAGHVQITLLGQNVNSYTAEGVGFPELMRRTAEIPGLKRLRFMTSHPKDCSDSLLEVLADGLPICPELHLPVQSGSDRVLRRMGRRYTADHYRERVETARKLVPGVLLSTDIITGFPGETEEDFRGTARLLEDIQYDNAFIYKYSERPNTPASRLVDDIPEDVKVRRLMELNVIVQESGQKKRLTQVGLVQDVLIEGPSPKRHDESIGRNPAGYMVVVPGTFQPGIEIPVRIGRLSGMTLRGEVLQDNKAVRA